MSRFDMSFPEHLIMPLLLSGISVETNWNAEDGLWFDLNTLAKSHMYLKKKDDKWFAHMRYNKVQEVTEADELAWLYKDCLHGRDYMSSAWVNFLDDPWKYISQYKASVAQGNAQPETEAA